jgi:hypothetical protein
MRIIALIDDFDFCGFSAPLNGGFWPRAVCGNDNFRVI